MHSLLTLLFMHIFFKTPEAFSEALTSRLSLRNAKLKGGRLVCSHRTSPTVPVFLLPMPLTLPTLCLMARVLSCPQAMACLVE